MDQEAIGRLLDAVRSSVAVHKFGNERAVALVPEGFTVHDISLLLPPPDRVKDEVTMLTAKSFVDYVARYGSPGATTIFADEGRSTYVAVIDYHNPNDLEDRRGTCEHIVRYECPTSLEWRAWTGASGKLMPQQDFARFIENNLPDINSPTAADMLAIALTLQVKKDAHYSSDLRLDNGQTQFRYEETIRGSSRAGDLSIPDSFRIAIPVFIGEPVKAIEAKLRYRISDQKLVIGFELVRAEAVLLEAVQKVTEGIRSDLVGFRLFIGRR